MHGHTSRYIRVTVHHGMNPKLGPCKWGANSGAACSLGVLNKILGLCYLICEMRMVCRPCRVRRHLSAECDRGVLYEVSPGTMWGLLWEVLPWPGASWPLVDSAAVSSMWSCGPCSGHWHLCQNEGSRGLLHQSFCFRNTEFYEPHIWVWSSGGN